MIESAIIAATKATSPPTVLISLLLPVQTVRLEIFIFIENLHVLKLRREMRPSGVRRDTRHVISLL